MGTDNVLTACIDAGVKKVICLSTDKTAYPVNATGTPKAMEEASVMMVGLKKERIMQGLELLEIREVSTFRHVADYSMPNVSDNVLRIILSYTNYVNRAVC